MNYEKKYKEMKARVLEIGRGYVKGVDYSKPRQIAEYIDPELKESEDEKIRKALMQNLKERFGTKGNMGEGLDMSDVLAWLEKQGEQKTEIEYIYPKFRIGDVIEPIKPNGFYPPVRVLSIEKKTKSYCCESDDHKHYSSIPIRCENEYKLVEQKPADNVEPKFREGEWITIKE